MKIIVLAGGLSPERDVSLLSGAGICKTLREMGHQAFLLDVFFGLPYDSDKLEEIFDRPDGGLEISKGISTSVPDLGALRKSRPDQSPSEIGPNVIELCQMADITFMALHGSIGENGKLQATFDNLGIKYTGPNSLGCTLSMNKLVTKQIFKTSGVPTPRGTSLTVKTKDTRLDELGYYLPLVVKPCSNGSSIGVYICHTEEDYYDAIHKSFDIDNTDEVVIEPFIKGREFACGILAGKALAECYPVEADLVVGVPDSGIAAAKGYAEGSGIPYGIAFHKNSYVGRTFIKPKQSQRESSVKIKLNVIEEVVRGKRIVMVDDSIVRGTTCANIIKMLKAAGAKEVHVRISSPPFLYPCYFGTDVPSNKDLIAHTHTQEEIRELIGADSLGYMKIEKLQETVGDICFCDACFTGNYPMEIPKQEEE